MSNKWIATLIIFDLAFTCFWAFELGRLSTVSDTRVKEGVRFIEAQDDDIQNMVDWDRARKTTTDDVKAIRRKMHSHNHIYVGSLGTIGVIVIEKYIFLAVLAWGLLHRPKKSGTIENPQQVEDADAE
jgi:hypothetical protein